MAITLDRLYESGEILSKIKSGGSQIVTPLDKSNYKLVLNGVKGDDNCKKLSSQFITRFFALFPEMSHEALDAILDLCEDDNVAIRKQAIKDLPLLCREMKEFLPKIADVLTQLLQTGDAGELSVIESSLSSLIRKDIKGTLIGLFSQIQNGGDMVRERAISFLFQKVKKSAENKEELFDRTAQGILITEIKNSLVDCTADEFHSFMEILNTTSLAETISGQSEMAEIVVSMAELDKPFNYLNKDCIDRLISCGEQASKYFSERVASTKFFEYVCLQVLPNLVHISDENIQTRILKMLAEFSQYTSTCNEPHLAISNVYDVLLLYIPLPDASDNSMETDQPEFEFTKVECLLAAFHTLGKQAPEHLTGNPELYKDFKIRLGYFFKGNTACMKKLKEYLDSRNLTEMKTEENRLKSTAYRSTNNLSLLIKDLFHVPPSYRVKIELSWKEKSKSVVTLKRKSITFNNGNQNQSSTLKRMTQSTSADRSIYKPPTGKYSGKVEGYDEEKSTFKRNSTNRNKRRGNKFYNRK